MSFQPIVLRELLVAQRNPATYRVRMTAGGGAMFISLWGITAISGWLPGASLGHNLLTGLASVTYVLSLFAGLFLSADCVSSERRNGTLGLLFLTDLLSVDVVLGKLAGKLLVPLYALLAMFPSLAVCVLLGGVTAGEFWRLFLVLANTLFFSITITICTSTVSLQQRRAYAHALLFLLISACAIPVAGYGLSIALGAAWPRLLSFLCSPTGSYLLAYDGEYRRYAGWFWAAAAFTHLLGWVGIGLACRIIPRIWQDERNRPHVLNSPEGSDKSDSRINRVENPRAVLDSDPIGWLMFRRNPPPIWLFFIAPLALFLQPLDLTGAAGTRNRLIWIGVIQLLHLIFKYGIAAQASHAFAQDKYSGALELLLGTPMQVSEIASGLGRAFVRQFSRSIATLLGADVLIALRFVLSDDRSSAIMMVVTAGLLLFDSYCLMRVGLWRGLISRSPMLAVFSTFFSIAILPWLWFGAGMGIFPQSRNLELLVLGLLASTVNNTIFFIKARDGFLDHFRTVALRPFGAKKPMLETRWSAINWDPPSDLDEPARLFDHDPEETAR